MAKKSYQCFLKSGSKKLLVHSIGHATRLALQSDYYLKAAETANLWLSHVEKKYDSHHLAIVMKGYKNYKKVGKYKEAFELIVHIIDAHFKYQNEQNDIINYLIEAQQLHVYAFKSLNKEIDQYIVSEYGSNFRDISNYYLELKNISSNLGLRALSDDFFVLENKYKKEELKKKGKVQKYISYYIWEKTCNYGVSSFRWFLCSFIIIVFFGWIFSDLFCSKFIPLELIPFFSQLNPSVQINSVDNWFTPFYFSIVTFTTLGFGDVTPTNLAGQIWIAIEVIIGYVMLGGLITIFTRKLVR